MKPYILAGVVSVVALAANAHETRQWKQFDTIGGETMFVDPATVKTDNGVTSVSILSDYDQVQGLPGKSSIYDFQFNCKARKLRSMSSAWFADAHAQGKAGSIKSKPEEWLDLHDPSVSWGEVAFSTRLAVFPKLILAHSELRNP